MARTLLIPAEELTPPRSTRPAGTSEGLPLTTSHRDRFEPVPVKVRSLQRARRRTPLLWSGSDARLERVRSEARDRAREAAKNHDSADETQEPD